LLKVNRTYAWILFTIPGVPPRRASLCRSWSVFSTKALNLKRSKVTNNGRKANADWPGLQILLSSVYDAIRQLDPLSFPLSSIVAVHVLPLGNSIAKELAIPHVLFANNGYEYVEAIGQKRRSLKRNALSIEDDRLPESSTYTLAVFRHDLFHIAQQTEVPASFAVLVKPLRDVAKSVWEDSWDERTHFDNLIAFHHSSLGLDWINAKSW
jgi:hypothetical protein